MSLVHKETARRTAIAVEICMNEEWITHAELAIRDGEPLDPGICHGPGIKDESFRIELRKEYVQALRGRLALTTADQLFEK
jgi:hypothetical protein